MQNQRASHLVCSRPAILLVKPIHVRLAFLSGLLWVVLRGISSLPLNKADIHATPFIKRLHCAGLDARLQGSRRGERTNPSGSRGSRVTQSQTRSAAAGGGWTQSRGPGGRGFGRFGGGPIGAAGGGTRRCYGDADRFRREGGPPAGPAPLERCRQIRFPQQSAAPEAGASGGSEGVRRVRSPARDCWAAVPGGRGATQTRWESVGLPLPDPFVRPGRPRGGRCLSVAPAPRRAAPGRPGFPELTGRAGSNV